MIIFVTKISRIMGKRTLIVHLELKRLRWRLLLISSFEDESVYYAAKKFLEDGLGYILKLKIQTSP